MTEANEKYNIVMPETTDRVLCMKIDRVISEDGYKDNFLPRIEAMAEKYNEIRILIYYKDFKGWEFDAAKADMFAAAMLGKKLKKAALINPPESELFQRSMKQALFSGEMKLFTEDKLDDALEWVKA